MFDQKLLEELPKLEKFYRMSLEETLPKYINDLMENLKNRTYENVFLSFDEKDINSIVIFGGKPVYDPLYTSIYVRERNYRNLQNFENCIKLTLKPSSHTVRPKYENYFSERCFYSYNDKKLKKRITVNFPEVKFKNKKVNNRQKYKGLERKAFREYSTESLRTEILNYINEEQNSLIYKGLTCKDHYEETIDEKNSLKTMIENQPLTILEKAFWRFADSNSLSTQNIISNKFTDLKSNFKSTELASFGKKIYAELGDVNMFEQLYFRNFFDIKYVKNIALAGGAVFGTLFKTEFIDYDIFFHNCNPEIAKYIIDSFITRASNHVQSVTKNENVVTVQLNGIPYFFEGANIYMYKNIIVQFILRIYNSPSEIIHGFDTDFSCCLYDFYTNSVYVTERFMYAITNGFNTVNLEKLSPSYEYRLLKGFKRGIGIKIPMLKHMLKNLEIGNLQKERGLATILKYMINFQFSEECDKPINNHDYSGLYSSEYTQNTELTFNITDPTSQAIGTFNRIIFEDYRNWFTFPKIKPIEIEESREIEEIKTDGFTKYNLKLLDCLPIGIKIYGTAARNIYNLTRDVSVIYLSTKEDPMKILKKFFIDFLTRSLENLKEIFSGFLAFSKKPEDFKYSEIMDEFFDNAKRGLENEFKERIIDDENHVKLESGNLVDEYFPFDCMKNLRHILIKTLWNDITDEQKDFIEDIKTLDIISNRVNLKIPEIVIWNEDNSTFETPTFVYDRIYAEKTSEGVKFVFDNSLKYYIETKTDPNLQYIKDVDLNSNYKLHENEDIALKEMIQFL